MTEVVEGHVEVSLMDAAEELIVGGPASSISFSPLTSLLSLPSPKGVTHMGPWSTISQGHGPVLPATQITVTLHTSPSAEGPSPHSTYLGWN